MSLRPMHETQLLRVRQAGWLMAFGARLWVTRHGDPDDHVLAPGERLAVACGDRLVLGPWNSGERASWLWEARRGALGPGSLQAWRGRLFVVPLEALARVLRGAAEGLRALARSAAATANRAQGCISAGDSIASAGTVQ